MTTRFLAVPAFGSNARRGGVRRSVLVLSALVGVSCVSDEIPVLPDTPNAPDGRYPSLPELDQQIENAMQSGGVPGLSACIIKDQEVQWCAGYGWADIGAMRPVNVDTPFLLASVSKVMAGATVMHAWQEGAIDLDASVSSFLPFPVQHPAFPAVPVTTRMLLTHQSGIVDNWDVMETLYVSGDPSIALGDFMESYLTPGGSYFDAERNFLAAGPDETVEYSNVAAALGAYGLEAAVGADFAAYSQENLFGPLGLVNTSWRLEGSETDELALPYELFDGEYETQGHYGFPDYPSGQLRSSAADVARFFAMLMNGGAVDGVRVLDEATVEEMRRLQRPGDEEQAIVWYYSNVDGEQLLGHDGSELGSRTEVQYRTRDDVGVVVLMNAESDSAIEAVMREMFVHAASL